MLYEAVQLSICYELWDLLLGDQATGVMTQYPTRSHYPDTEITSPWIILVMPNAMVDSDKYRIQIHDLQHWYLHKMS